MCIAPDKALFFSLKKLLIFFKFPPGKPTHSSSLIRIIFADLQNQCILLKIWTEKALITLHIFAADPDFTVNIQLKDPFHIKML